MLDLALASSPLDREQARDLRRSVLCGELSWGRDAVDDGWDEDADLALAVSAGKPVGTARLIVREQRAWVDLCAVLPRCRRQGLGSALLAFLEVRVLGRGLSELWVLAPASSGPFFRAVGFSAQGGEAEVLLLRKPLAIPPLA
ncbi:MAG: GNAT family N-acetyltransferase [bacterium]